MTCRSKQPLPSSQQRNRLVRHKLLREGELLLLRFRLLLRNFRPEHAYRTARATDRSFADSSGLFQLISGIPQFSRNSLGADRQAPLSAPGASHALTCAHRCSGPSHMTPNAVIPTIPLLRKQEEDGAMLRAASRDRLPQCPIRATVRVNDYVGVVAAHFCCLNIPG